MTEIVNSDEGGVKSITITRPDDWHLHVRTGPMLRMVLPYTARVFGRAIIMPNLKEPITTVARAFLYREEILSARPQGSNFEPLMTLYLTDNTSLNEIILAKKSGIVHGVKYYPAGATTNSDSGVTDISKVYTVLDMMELHGMPLLVHGEVTDFDVDIFDREKMFLDRVLKGIIENFPDLKIVLEHVTTKEGVDFVKEAGANIAATITAHHLHINRNNMLVGGIQPHNYCLPVAKREVHRQALVNAATSGNKKFFLGTDSAPHAQTEKEKSCGCAGCFTAPSSMELYVRAFDMVGKLGALEAFASFNGPDFYGLPRNKDTVTLESVDRFWHLPHRIPFGGSTEVVVPFTLKEGLSWRHVE